MFGGWQSILVVWALLGPALVGGLTWTATKAQQRIIRNGAVQAEITKQVAICAKQLTDQALLMEANVQTGIGDAGAAADRVTTPAERAELALLCESDPTCRRKAP